MTSPSTSPETGPRREDGWRGRLEAHLGSRDVARVIYGAIVGLALVIALQEHPPPATAAATLLAAAALAVGLAELYSEVVSQEARTRRAVARSDMYHMVREALWVVGGSGFPAVFFALAALHALALPTAFALAKWSGLTLICGYGFLAARLAGASVPRGLAHAAVLGVLAGALIALKALIH